MHLKLTTICLIISATLLSILIFFLLDKPLLTKEESHKILNLLEYSEESNNPNSITSLSEKLGQNFIVGIPTTQIDDKTIEILHHIKPAGIVLYSRNFESFSQLKELILELQKISKEDSNMPYFIMLDEEPEGALRVGLLKNIFSLEMPQWKKIERDINILSSLGINVELAPLADFPFDNNSFVARRIPVKTVEELVSFNRTFIKILKDYKISATLKHFPGMGIFEDDPHNKFLHSNISENSLKKSIDIFKDGINNGADFVMTCHAMYDNLDSENPATFSRTIVTDILKDQLNFKGIIVTDDISDMPLSIKGLDLTDAGIKALKAGHNLIMFSHNLDKTKEIFDEILYKVNTDPELKTIIENNYLKIIAFKDKNLNIKIKAP